MTKLAKDLASLGFYKFVTDEQRSVVDDEISHGAYDWYRAAGRAFDGDAERLAEGGVKELLEAMGPVLDAEGVKLPELDETYSENGYTLRVGTDSVLLWGEDERKRSWELTLRRTITLVNNWLANAGSDERVYVLGGGNDAVLVLLTPALRQAIANSGAFKEQDIPVAL